VRYRALSSGLARSRKEAPKNPVQPGSFRGCRQHPNDACEKKAGRVSSPSLVRYRGTDYSVPTAYGHREVVIRGCVHAMVISCGAEVIARHPRSYEREDFVFDPLHYLALLERKIGVLDQAAPLVGWDLAAACWAASRSSRKTKMRNGTADAGITT
jgi:hypothetical protein